MSSPRELLNTIVWSADVNLKKAPKGVKMVKVPAHLIEVARDLLRGPTPEGKRYLKNLMRAKFYGPNKALGSRWRIVKRTLTRDDLVMLCRQGDEYVVLTFWLPRISPEMCPSDSFTSGAKNGEAMFADVIARLTSEPKLALSTR